MVYDSMKQARIAARIGERKHGGSWDSYLCKKCNGYHIGHRVGANPDPYTVALRAKARAKPNVEPILRKRRLD